MTGKIITVAQQKGGSGKTTLAVNLGLALWREGSRVAFLDTDPQGSLGRWFMTRIESRGEDEALSFGTASAWGVGYETAKLARDCDFVIIDTPPKADSDLRPSLRAADLAIIPVAASHLDLWATEGVLDLAEREHTDALIVLNRLRSGTRLAAEIATAAEGVGGTLAASRFNHRQAYAESLGRGLGAMEVGARAAAEECRGFAAEVRGMLS